LVAAFATAALPQAAQAADCSNPITQSDMTFCAGQDFAQADKALNAAYAKARDQMRAIDADLPADQRGAAAALLAAQKAWITFRDQACIAEGYPNHGGSIEPMVVAECRTRLTQARTKDLTDLTAQN
jgi:uncharacterized protein YecT (DUF1311 family)